MPRLRRLSGDQIIKILVSFRFEVISFKGSHYKLRRIVDGHKQTLHVPVHGSTSVSTGTLSAIYKQASAYIAEDELRPYFYTD